MTYDELKTAGICVKCQCRPAITGQSRCQRCAERANERRRLKSIKPFSPVSVYSLGEIVRQADAEGLSYGKYVAKYGL